MSEIICERCGGTVEGKNYFTYCKYKKGFVHVRCEQACENYSADMLPNSTHCKKKFFEEETKYRLLSSKILAPDHKVQCAVSKYEGLNSTKLYEKFLKMVNIYKIIDRDDIEKKARYRVELAAMQQILRKRELENPKLSLWARRFFGEVGDDS